MVYPGVSPQLQQPRWPQGLQGARVAYPPLAQPPSAQPLAPVSGLSVSPAQVQAMQQQLAAVQPSMPPQMQQLLAQQMQDPAFLQQMAALDQAIQSGQLKPEQLQQMMTGGMPGTMSAEGMIPDFNPVKWAKIGLMAAMLGLIGGKVIDYAIDGSESSRYTTLLDRALLKIQQLPGIARIDAKLGRKIASPATPGFEHIWRRMDGQFSGAQSTASFYQTYLGSKGHFADDLAKLNVPAKLRQTLAGQVKSAQDLSRVLNNGLEHFVSDAARPVIQDALAQSRPGVSWFGRAAAKPVLTTLAQADKLIEKAAFETFLSQAVSEGRLTREMQRGIQTLISTVPQGSKLHAADAFAAQVNRLMAHGKFAPEVKRLLGLSGSGHTYDAFQSALKSQTGSRQAIWEALSEAVNPHTASTFKFTPQTTVCTVQKQLNQSHLLTQIQKRTPSAGKSLFGMLKGLFHRGSFMERNYQAVADAEHALANGLRQKGVGPVGRLLGKAFYYLQRTFSGGGFKPMGLSTPGLNSGSLFGRVFVSLFIFGFALHAFNKPNKVDPDPTKPETLIAKPEPASMHLKIARFFDVLATGLGGYMGYEVGRSFIPQTGLFTHIKPLAKIAAKRVFGVLPFTYGGFLAELVAPAVVGAVFSYVAQKGLNLIFGDPKVMSEAPTAKQPANPAVTSPKDSVKPAASPLEMLPAEALTPENTGLLPEQIAVNEQGQMMFDQSKHLTKLYGNSTLESMFNHGSH